MSGSILYAQLLTYFRVPFSKSLFCFVLGFVSEFPPQEFLLLHLLDPETGDDGALVNDEQGLVVELKNGIFSTRISYIV